MNLAEEMMSLFDGKQSHYGSYVVLGVKDSRGKMKGKPKTELGEVNIELWNKHLSTDQGIGIIPIRDDSTAKFGAIDVDNYNLDHAAMLKKINDLNLPLVVCKSKSGGAHLYMFLKDPVPAGDLIDKLKEYSALLGLANKTEIFPKQRKILSEQGDVGNWINMPYSNHKQTARPALDAMGDPISIEDFIELAKSKRLPLEVFYKENDTQKSPNIFSEDGPPCLEILINQDGGILEGKRNPLMFNVGVYCKQRYGKDWKTELEKINREYCVNLRGEPHPMDSQEMSQLINSLEGKQYYYTCDQDPICGVCNKGKCMQRRFGVGSNALPDFGLIRKLMTDPPIFFWDIDGVPIPLQVEELTNVYKIRNKALQYTNKLLPLMKKEVFDPILRKSLEGIEDSERQIEVPEDATPQGELYNKLVSFCLLRTGPNSKKEDLIENKVWYDKDTGKHYFASSTFLEYLDEKRYRDLTKNKVIALVKEKFGVNIRALRIGKTTKRYWEIEINPDLIPSYAKLGKFETTDAF